VKKSPIQTTSTKCQYALTASTAMWCGRELAGHAAGQDHGEPTTPPKTWAPWKPVMV
jgi:hypothetical protein